MFKSSPILCSSLWFLGKFNWNLIKEQTDPEYGLLILPKAKYPLSMVTFHSLEKSQPPNQALLTRNSTVALILPQEMIPTSSDRHSLSLRVFVLNPWCPAISVNLEFAMSFGCSEEPVGHLNQIFSQDRKVRCREETWATLLTAKKEMSRQEIEVVG